MSSDFRCYIVIYAIVSVIVVLLLLFVML